MKRFIAILLCALMVVPQAAAASLASNVSYEDAEDLVENTSIDVSDSVVYNAENTVVDLEFPDYDGVIKEGSIGSWSSQEVDGEWKSYFEYMLNYDIGWITAHYNDGTSREYHSSETSIVNIEVTQDYFNQWTAGGIYSATVTVEGYSETLDFYIDPTNIEKFEVLETKPIYEGDGDVNGYYDRELDTFLTYVRYDEWDAIGDIKVYYKDGTTEICDYDELGSKIEGSVFLYGNQGPDSPSGIWTVGNTYTALLSCGMFEDTFEISIIENPIESIEVVETQPIMENTNGWLSGYWDENNNYVEWYCYYAQNAVKSVKINYKNGTSEILPTNQLGSWGSSTNQTFENPWTVGNTYSATFKYMGKTCEFEVSIVEYVPYTYIVQDGEAYITGMADQNYFTNNGITDLVFPSEIHGYPVVGINYISGRYGSIKTITLPETLKYISSWALSNFYNTETIYVEGTETVLSLDAFGGGMYNLKEFVVNEAHPDYTSIDGVIFDKEVTTVVVYPTAKGDTYELPITISDLRFIENYPDVNFIVHPESTEFIIENGITYDKNKTQIISCDKTISGEYVMPETVEFIPQMTFQGCENLTSVVMSPLVTEIAYATFDNCPNLTSVDLPAELQTISNYAFSDCTALQSIELPSKLALIDYKAFYNTALKGITIPGSVTYIGEYSFMSSQLETVVTEDFYNEEDYGDISNFAFANNENLKTVVLGEGFSSIGNSVFSNCVSLEEINIPDSCYVFGPFIFNNCDSLTYLPIGVNQNSISTGEFNSCDGLVEVTIPKHVTTLGDQAFSGCKSLKKVEMPDNLTNIGSYAFSDCYSLTELPLSANQIYISKGEFTGCIGLKDVVLSDSITYISAFAFSSCENLKSINLSDKIEYIGRGAFQDCKSLKKAYVGKYIEEIHMYTFKNSGITEITIGEKVNYVGYESFMNSKLTSVNIPASVTEIAYFAFFGCEDLININMPDTLVELGGHSFGATKWYNNKPEGMVYLGTSLYNYKGDIPEGTELYVKPGTLAIAGHAFENGCHNSWYWDYEQDERYQKELYDRSGLQAIHIPEGVEFIGESAFYGCDNLKEIYLPASLKRIGTSAFDNMKSSDVVVYYGGSEEQWGAFEREVGNFTFDNCEFVFNYIDSEYPTMPDTTLKGWIFGKDGKWYFYENDMAVMSQWRKDSKGWCYLGSDGAMVTDKWVMDSKGWCYVGGNGYCVTNCWKKDSIGWIWLDSEGSMAKSKWINDGGKWYYVDANGYMKTGWLYDNNKWYYLDSDGAMVKNQWRKDSIGWCYLLSDGSMATNQWVMDSKGWCYIGGNGYCVTNCWKKDSTGWIYLDSEGSMTKSQWISDGGKWYYVDANGYMVTGWKAIGGSWYYMASSGVMVTGWQSIGGSWYYMASNGTMVTGKAQIDGKWYTFAPSGVWIG
ncbi:MAG: leucine-rich repeat protein [Clostridia bacterium]|nr:leucine-rich repeat protein [Clostridia bacterium]